MFDGSMECNECDGLHSYALSVIFYPLYLSLSLSLSLTLSLFSHDGLRSDEERV